MATERPRVYLSELVTEMLALGPLTIHASLSSAFKHDLWPPEKLGTEALHWHSQANMKDLSLNNVNKNRGKIEMSKSFTYLSLKSE